MTVTKKQVLGYFAGKSRSPVFKLSKVLFLKWVAYRRKGGQRPLYPFVKTECIRMDIDRLHRIMIQVNAMRFMDEVYRAG